MSRRQKRQAYQRHRIARLEMELVALRLEAEKLQEWQKAEIVIRALQEGEKEPEPGSPEWWKKHPLGQMTLMPIPNVLPPPPPIPVPQPWSGNGDPPGWWQHPVIYTVIGSGELLPNPSSTPDVKGSR